MLGPHIARNRLSLGDPIGHNRNEARTHTRTYARGKANKLNRWGKKCWAKCQFGHLTQLFFSFYTLESNAKREKRSKKLLREVIDNVGGILNRVHTKRPKDNWDSSYSSTWVIRSLADFFGILWYSCNFCWPFFAIFSTYMRTLAHTAYIVENKTNLLLAGWFRFGRFVGLLLKGKPKGELEYKCFIVYLVTYICV